MDKKRDEVPDGDHVIYVKWVTTRNGKRIYAATYGKKAFRLIIRKPRR